MKNLIPGKLVLMIVLLLGIGFTACQKVQDAPAAEDLALEPIPADDDVIHTEGEGYNKMIHNHVDEQPVYLSSVEEVSYLRPDGTLDDVLLVDGDIEMTNEQFEQIRMQNDDPIKQYRTSNLVSSPQTITVIGYTGGSYALTTKMRTGLSWAIANYNSLNIGLNFSLSFTASTNADIVVYRNYLNSGAGGSAGFPSGGNPYKWVQIYAGMNNYSNNVNEHVVGHEIGHCLGLRHTDYFSRASCGQNSNEGSAGVGAIHIPGTPTGIDWNSLMLACFSSSEDGEFGAYDRIALEYLY